LQDNQNGFQDTKVTHRMASQDAWFNPSTATRNFMVFSPAPGGGQFAIFGRLEAKSLWSFLVLTMSGALVCAPKSPISPAIACCGGASSAFVPLAQSMRSDPPEPEKGAKLKFAIDVGETEKHRLHYHFNQLLGSLAITVNGKPVKKERRLINEPVLEVHVVVVGKNEKSTIRIEKERKGLIGHRNRLYVNNRLVKVLNGV
jgi:hypothetical protein